MEGQPPWADEANETDKSKTGFSHRLHLNLFPLRQGLLP